MTYEQEMKEMYPQAYADLGVSALDTLAGFYIPVVKSEGRIVANPELVSTIQETYHNVKRRLPERFDDLHQLADVMYNELERRLVATE